MNTNTEISGKFSPSNSCPVLILGAGLAGLSAAIKLAENNIPVTLISNMPSERAGSCMAEGGINAALDHMGEGDSVENHFAETLEAGEHIADPEAVRALTQAGPEIVNRLHQLGVRFTLTDQKEIAQRAFGGQKYRRTVYAKDSTGKQIMTALIDEARKYEARGLITRYSHHSFVKTLRVPVEQNCNISEQNCNISEQKGRASEPTGSISGCLIRDDYSGQLMELNANALIIACGGLHGLFGDTTGALTDNGHVQAELLAEGVQMTNLEFIQFHPTTVSNGAKRMLITEAARGEGGRLCVKAEDGRLHYFMEEKYPESGNLMSRDVTAREVYKESCKGQVYLDLRHLDPELFQDKLNNTMQMCRSYLHLDPAKDLIPVKAGIHYFMGGIDVDGFHRTNVKGLYAAGECAGIYHGANRLGGNSLLGAIRGGQTAAESVMEDLSLPNSEADSSLRSSFAVNQSVTKSLVAENTDFNLATMQKIRRILTDTMSVIRNENSLMEGISALDSIQSAGCPELLLARAIILSALKRRESRGAHYRSDHPDSDPDQARPSKAILKGGEILIEL